MKVFMRKIYVLLLLSVFFSFNLYSSSTVVENANDICYGVTEETGMSMGPVNIKYTGTTPITSLNNYELTDVHVALGTSSLFSAFSECGVDGVEGNCSDASGKSFMMMSVFNDGVNFDLEDLSQNETHSPYTKAMFKLFSSGDYEWIGTYVKNGVTHVGKMKPCPVSYCEEHGLSAGFNVIDPDGGDEDNSFEIFCHEDVNNIWHDLIVLPIKNTSNNFLFDSNETTLNYYDENNNSREHFQAIEIDGGHIIYDGTQPKIPVVSSRSDEPWDVTTDGNNYKVMGGKFSNINLIGTPYTIDWGNTKELLDCNESKLRKALSQAVKYNTTNLSSTSNDGKSRCQIDTMNLSLLDDYRFLVYDGEEVLQHSCKEMASYVPDNTGVLNNEDVVGHFNVLTSEPAYVDSVPTTNGERVSSTDIGDAKIRPLTVYCKYQTDLNYVWTFLTALDASVTQYKTDLVTHNDTCSQLGLYFYVPNSKDTFNRVRNYLKDQKTGDDGWENYTGTIEEKINALHAGNSYYLSEFRNVLIWPYGPLGVYFPHNGNLDKEDNTINWGNANSDVQGYMSGAPMHNIATMSNYASSMGHKGWVSILGSQDLNKTDEWWISDIGAGEEIGNDPALYSPHGTHPIQSAGFKYYEPNGNYDQDAWLNFLFDSDGWIYHNDDWNANYPYYDYMCMAETNYDEASRYSLVPGFFDVIERSRNLGGSFSDLNLTTQIVQKPISLDLLLYKIDGNTGLIDKSQLEDTKKKSVGVFLSYMKEKGSPIPVKFLGEYKDFDEHDGRISINNFSAPSASKRTIVQFYFCTADADWRTCWDYNNNADSPTVNYIADGAHSDSTDDFAIRPDRFGISISGSTIVQAQNVTLNYYAYEYGSSNPANGYNEPFSNLEANTTLADSTKIPNCPNTSLTLNFPTAFTDGVENNDTRLSNVGIFNIVIKEQDGQQFASVDVDDNTIMENSIYITPADINLTILPDHFKITPITNANTDSNFTYLSNDLNNMAIKFDFNVTAQNDQNVTTPNYTTGCYANNINVDINFSSSSNMPTKIIYKELNSSIEGNVTSATNLFSVNAIPSTIFSTDHNGTAEVKIRANFQRDKNESLNPFNVKFSDLNVSDRTTSVKVGTDASQLIDANATMIYGRTHASRQRYSTDIIPATPNVFDATAKIYFESFCFRTDANGNACDKNLLPNGMNSNRTNDIRWYINTNHSDATKHGSAGTVKEKYGNGTISDIVDGGATATLTPNGVTSITLHYDTTQGLPYKTTMENNASSWLIYNEDNANATVNEFPVEFEGGDSGWSGAHDTNTTTNSTKITKTTNRRTMW